jgi:hypothetical protein
VTRTCAGRGCDRVIDAVYRCKDCYDIGMYCRECILALHAHHLLHKVEVTSCDFTLPGLDTNKHIAMVSYVGIFPEDHAAKPGFTRSTWGSPARDSLSLQRE